MRIGIIGARLSGSYAGLQLARMKHEILLFDHTTLEEKPCGGGITAKALRRMPWLYELRLPCNTVDTLLLVTGDGRKCSLPLCTPMQIFSRLELDAAIRDAAQQAGARLLPQRAEKFIAQKHGWVVSTASRSYEVDFLIGADGVASSVRAALIGRYCSSDLVLALGYYLPGIYHPHTAVAAFQENGFPGYLWSFPRVDHSSIGIGCWLPQSNAKALRRRLLAFILLNYPNEAKTMRFFAARIPCLGRRTLMDQRVCGPNWALVGDAAGFADAITAEGIYFALRSAELLAGAIRGGAPESYENAWRRDFGGNLLKAAEWRDWFYAGTFLSHAVTRRATQAIMHSITVRQIVDAVIGGRCTYAALRRQMILRIPRILVEVIVSRLGRELRDRDKTSEG